MNGFGRIVLVAVLGAAWAGAATASISPPGCSMGQCLPVVLTGVGTTPDQATPVTVVIDIKPGQSPNKIWLNRNYAIDVAVFGSSDLSVLGILRGTVAFGRTGFETDPVQYPLIRDINSDGFYDAIYRFMTDDCGFYPGNEYGVWRGVLWKGGTAVSLLGVDGLVVMP
jgi:hypothetical protein